jgi:DNA polymerase I
VENALDHAAEVERKMYRESLQNNREQILLSKKLATIDVNCPIKWDLGALKAQEPDAAALKPLYRELEFYSFLREMGPLEDTAPKDYGALTNPEEVSAFVAQIPGGAPIGVAADSSAIAISYRKSYARSMPMGLVPEAFLQEPGRVKVTHDVKSASMMPGNGYEDLMLEAFLLSADPGGCGLEVLAEKFLDRKLGETIEHRADAILELYERISPEIAARGLRKVYDDIDLPLAPVLARMERVGIRIEPTQLQVLSERMDAEMQRLSAEIYSAAGKEFNINSPQQLGKVLYEDLNLPSPTKYGKGKITSTAADILETLALDYPIARLVLEFRQLAKLKGTYVDALPLLIQAGTGRLHTTFNQTGAATGRLSSSNPNLQNIPIRTELGREIRAAFVPCEGWDLVVADYSQIELRLLAHMSGDPTLTKAFRNGEDIHTRTAAEVFRVPPLMITSEMRRSAKAVNFGIVYGQTPFGLAASIGVDRKEAERYIKSYFELYSGVRTFIDATIAEVRQTGIAKTLLGRERPIPDMHSRNPNARSFAERTAVNTPLQGTAADLIKLAMIRIDRLLTDKKLQTKMLLQVHDELLFESPPEETHEVKQLVKSEMENVYRLSVPLLVDIGVGANWRDAK